MSTANGANEFDTQKGKNLTFLIEEDSYGLEIKYVKQIIGVQEIAIVPKQPDYIKGVINLRGEIIPIMDMRLKFLKEERPYDDRTCIIVLEISGDTIGIIVDSVSDVLDIADDQISDAPEFDSNIQNKYIRGIARVNNKLIILLDCEELVKFVDTSITDEYK
jgi:purine-binding chemotaxis protein CheW